MESSKLPSNERGAEIKALTEELTLMDSQIQKFTNEIDSYDKTLSSEEAFRSSFATYSSSPNKFSGFPARNEDGFSGKEVKIAQKVFEVFSRNYIKHHEDLKKQFLDGLKIAKDRKIKILEKLRELGATLSPKAVEMTRDDQENSPAETLTDKEKLVLLQQEMVLLQREIESVSKRADYQEKYPSPESIVVPEDGETLPQGTDYPHLLDIHAALEQAQKDGQYIYALDTKAENDKRIKYLKRLIKNSPEHKQVADANERAGVEKISVSFSREQALFLRTLQDDPEISRLESQFSSGLERKPEKNGVIELVDYEGSDMSQVRYHRDLLSYIEKSLKSNHGELPQWFIQKKQEFEKLFPEKAEETK